MPKRYMSENEYEQQQFRWKHSLIDPQLLQSIIDGESHAGTTGEEEDEKVRRHDLKEKLWSIITQKIEKSLTLRQQDAIRLFLMGKKQEHSGEVLGVTQEAANVRLRLGFERLRKACEKDKEVQRILQEIRQ